MQYAAFSCLESAVYAMRLFSVIAPYTEYRYKFLTDPEFSLTECEDDLAGEYIKSLLEGAPLPNLHDRIAGLKYTDGAKFFDSAQQAVFPQRDFHLSTAVDSCNFVLRLTTDPETGLACMERVDIL